jgi:hypothetical protein
MVVLAYHIAAKRLSLPESLGVISYHQADSEVYTYRNRGGDIMAEHKTQDYFEETNEGHIDTREANFKCDNPDPHLGCDMGIDVAG